MHFSVYVNITANTVNLTNALTANNGGTGLKTFNTGDMLYAGAPPFGARPPADALRCPASPC